MTGLTDTLARPWALPQFRLPDWLRRPPMSDFFFPGCGCCEEIEPADCGICYVDLMPQAYDVIVDGITVGNCASVGDLNGTHTVEYSQGCFWFEPLDVHCVDGSSVWVSYHVNGTIYPSVSMQLLGTPHGTLWAIHLRARKGFVTAFNNRQLGQLIYVMPVEEGQSPILPGPAFDCTTTEPQTFQLYNVNQSMLTKGYAADAPASITVVAA